MTPEQLNALMECIKAHMDERIESAFGRDSGHEYLHARGKEAALYEAFGFDEDRFGNLVQKDGSK